ncbi:5-methyltetrahydropteroyltriglutamate--homocysteine methyltransferase 2 [Nicotiana attenuata]|uniref:5-methyltetrahydropteroyltriglutamate--homocysteine methyltransferase 2 n=1 Tax=Nicotiana attenuata TaxID=49451 RepID=A0A1J6IWM4_NICAT|nr:5-methyltetrahydropteroyltriglutamate--homocysteine methyltransferase 2 [Nicotiana attenuata]OIT28249.1 5-methyltetrahydropteroyltriglutamate--homocysteine methyltransferase 2 [Nicotiana attenuata]
MVLAFVLDLRHPGFHPPMKLLTESRRCLQDTNILWFNPDCGLKNRKYAEVKPCSQQWLVNCSMVLLEHTGLQRKQKIMFHILH